MNRQKYSSILAYEIKKGLGEPVYLFFFILPFLISLLFRFGWPVAEDLLNVQFGFLLEPYRLWLGIIMLYLAPQFLGMPLGFRLLEEKDRGTLTVFSVMPLGLAGYIGMLLVGTGLCIFFAQLGLGLILAPWYSEISLMTFLLIGLLMAIEGGIFALFLSLLANDKLQGMTMGKVLSLLTVIPVLVLVFPESFATSIFPWLAAIFPWFWPVAIVYLELPIANVFAWFIAFSIHLLWIFIIIRVQLRSVSRGSRF